MHPLRLPHGSKSQLPLPRTTASPRLVAARWSPVTSPSTCPFSEYWSNNNVALKTSSNFKDDVFTSQHDFYTSTVPLPAKFRYENEGAHFILYGQITDRYAINGRITVKASNSQVFYQNFKLRAESIDEDGYPALNVNIQEASTNGLLRFKLKESSDDLRVLIWPSREL